MQKWLKRSSCPQNIVIDLGSDFVVVAESTNLGQIPIGESFVFRIRFQAADGRQGRFLVGIARCNRRRSERPQLLAIIRYRPR